MDSRVSLRRVTPDDADQVARWRAEPSVRRYQPLGQRSLTELHDMLRMRGVEPVRPHAFGEFQWIVETADGDAGWVTVSIISPEHRTASLGYSITERLRGRGYATAAVRAVFPLVFRQDKLDLYRLEAVAAVDNIASRRVLTRCGFHCEGIARAYLIIGGVRADHARYALLRPDWENTNKAACASPASA